MKKVYSSENKFLFYRVKNLFESEEIECFVKNEHISSVIGEVPPIESWLELWILDDGQFDQAQNILKKALSAEVSAGLEWVCPGCGERHEQHFTECWKCQTNRPL